jgi:hypothetical protein
LISARLAKDFHGARFPQVSSERERERETERERRERARERREREKRESERVVYWYLIQ